MNIYNSLFTDACLNHFKQYKKAEWRGKIFHLVVGTLEAFPVAGQIVSLIELGIIRFFTGPTPTHSTASTQTEKQIVLTKTPSTLPDPISYRPTVKQRYIWPDNLSLLNLTLDQKNFIDKQLRLIGTFTGSVSYFKKQMVFTIENSNPNVVPLPITLTMEKIGDVIEIILLPNKIFAEGRERKIKWAYNLNRGEYYIKKRIVGIYEEITINTMDQLRKERGVVNINFWRTALNKKGVEKRQLIEPMRNGDLSILFNTNALEEFSTKKSIIIDLLHELNDFSRIRITKALVQNRKIDVYHSFHQDIKVPNILVTLKGGKWRAELSDFGECTNVLDKQVHTRGYSSPEYIQCRKYQTSLIDFHLKYGPKRDIWSMGIVLLMVLTGQRGYLQWKESNKEIYAHTAPLPSLVNCLQQKIIDPPYHESGILDLTQSMIDQDFEVLEKEVKGQHVDDKAEVTLLFTVIKEMIRINPEERKSAAELLKKISS